VRGVHVHPHHEDWFLLLRGEALVALRDLRRGSPTEGVAAVLPVRGDAPAAVLVPRGVAHGFRFLTECFHVYGLTRAWDPADYLGCRWDDPELGLDWPLDPAILSEKDENASSLRVLLERIGPWQPFEGPLSPGAPRGPAPR
jgi:dTDP-4-dehydrorhamnose 3,5-epimerase